MILLYPLQLKSFKLDIIKGYIIQYINSFHIYSKGETYEKR